MDETYILIYDYDYDEYDDKMSGKNLLFISLICYKNIIMLVQMYIIININ